MDELNGRKAVVFCHPFCAACETQTTLSDAQNRGVEFVFDTTRTILSLLSTGTVTRCPDIRFIWSHGGGTVPYITTRLAGAASKLPKGLIYELQKFYYDTAQPVHAAVLQEARSGLANIVWHGLPSRRRFSRTCRQGLDGQRRIHRARTACH
jgi:6-methylsalicylate decarboxylase